MPEPSALTIKDTLRQRRRLYTNEIRKNKTNIGISFLSSNACIGQIKFRNLPNFFSLARLICMTCSHSKVAWAYDAKVIVCCQTFIDITYKKTGRTRLVLVRSFDQFNYGHRCTITLSETAFDNAHISTWTLHKSWT